MGITLYPEIPISGHNFRAVLEEPQHCCLYIWSGERVINYTICCLIQPSLPYFFFPWPHNSNSRDFSCLRVNAELELEGYYFNDELSAWEPLIEPIIKNVSRSDTWESHFLRMLMWNACGCWSVNWLMGCFPFWTQRLRGKTALKVMLNWHGLRC